MSPAYQEFLKLPNNSSGNQGYDLVRGVKQRLANYSPCVKPSCCLFLKTIFYVDKNPLVPIHSHIVSDDFPSIPAMLGSWYQAQKSSLTHGVARGSWALVSHMHPDLNITH